MLQVVKVSNIPIYRETLLSLDYGITIGYHNKTICLNAIKC
jgi:hypothetical protein